MDALSSALSPLLRALFPRASRDSETLGALSANVSANLLGLGNAATPMGIRAAQGMAAQSKRGVASSELCLLVVINTASIQLLPTTVAAVRAATAGGVDKLGRVRARGRAGCEAAAQVFPGMSELTSLIPAIIMAATALYGAVRGVDVFEAMAAGVMDGLRVVVKIFPSLVALLTAVYMLRASGVLDALTRLLSPVLGALGIPSETGALMLLRPVSGSGALAVASELIAQYGADSPVGRTAAVMLGSTETTFYVIAVYFGAAGIKKTRYAVPAALCADLTGFVVSALTVRLFWP